MTKIPEARWAGPEDSLWDIHYADFERWVDDHYDMATQTILGIPMTWEEAAESDDLLDHYLERRYRV